jgi:hypothetical protein
MGLLVSAGPAVCGSVGRLMFFDFATNQSTTIAELGIFALGLSASRDGRIVLFSQFEPPTGDLVMVENFK